MSGFGLGLRLHWRRQTSGGGVGVPVMNTGGEPYFVEDPLTLGTPATTLTNGIPYYIYLGSFTNSPTTWTWQVLNNATNAVIASGTSTAQGEDFWQPIDENVGLVVRLETVASNGAGSSTAAVSATRTIQQIDVSNAITAFSRTSSSGVTPITISLTYGANARAGGKLGFNVYSDQAKTTLLRTGTKTLANADLAPGATIDLAAMGVTYAATDWLEAFYQMLSPGGVPYTYTYATAISPTDPLSYEQYEIAVSSTSSGFYTLLAEFELYSTVGGANIANNSGFTISANNAAGGAASNARDGNFATYWATDFGGVAYPHTIKIDMRGGTPVPVAQVGLGCANPGGGAGFPKDFIIYGYPVGGGARVALSTQTNQTGTDGVLNKYTL